MKRLIKPLTLFLLGFSLIVAVSVVALYIAIPILGERKVDIERLATQIIQHPVKIESSKGIWLDAEPGLMLKNLVVFDKNGVQPLLKISELQVGFKILTSLWQKNPVIGHLFMKDAHIKIQQSINHKISVVGLPEIDQSNISLSDDLPKWINWLTTEREIKLDHVVVDWQKPDGSQVNIPYFALTLHNNWHAHRGNLRLHQTNVGALLKDENLNGWQISDGKINALTLHWGLNYQTLNYIKGSINADGFTIVQPNANTAPHLSTNRWQLKSLFGHFLWRGKLHDQWLLKLQRVQFNLDGQNWVEKNLRINAQPIKKGGFLYTVHASNLHLANLWLPLKKLGVLSAEHQDAVKHLNPQGDFKNIYLEYPYTTAINNEPLLNWKFAAEIHDLGLSPWQKIPGIQPLTGYLQVSNGMGQLRLDNEKLTLTFPKFFRSPLFFQNAQTNIDWEILPTGYKINAANIEVENSDAKFKGDMSLWLPHSSQSPFINLFGEFTINANAKIPSYLSTSIVTPSFLKWFDQALPSMAGGKGTLILRGLLKDFPFPHKEGIFAVRTQLNDVTLRYLPNWPVITHLFAKLNFDGPKMSMFINSGKVFASQIKSAYVEIPVILKGIDAILHVKTDLVGDLRDGSRFISQSPLNKKFGATLGLLKIDGDSEIKLNVDINLENDNAPTQVHGNIDMSEAKMRLPFKQLAFENITGILHFTQDGIQASSLQAEFLHDPITVNIKNDKNTQTLFQFAGKTRLFDLQKALQLPHLSHIEGSVAYQTKLTVPHSPSKEPNQLLITSNLKGIKASLPPPFNKSSNDSAPSQVLINFADDQPPTISFTYADKFNGTLSRTENSWLLGLVSANIVGQLTIPDDEETAWNAHFEKLYLQANPPSSKSNLDPTDVPRLNCFAHDFRYGNKQFGQVHLVLEPLENGLKIQRLAAQSPAFSLLAQGRWQNFSNRQYTNLTGQITSYDIGSALLRLGMPASIVGKNGKLLFNLEWPNPPYDPLIKSLAGHLDIALDNGRIVDIGEETSQKIGMGKLLNFFGLQNLPRHLTLDFSDVSKQGFPFDIMRGHFMLKNGNAYTKDTYWDGSVAHISMKGSISLANENYDLYLSVTPHITSSLPIVATIAGGPVVGLSAWVADKLLSKQVGKLMTYSYHMHGPWSQASLTEA